MNSEMKVLKIVKIFETKFFSYKYNRRLMMKNPMVELNTLKKITKKKIANKKLQQHLLTRLLIKNINKSIKNL